MAEDEIDEIDLGEESTSEPGTPLEEKYRHQKPLASAPSTAPPSA
jgi:hypothetical protein